MPIYIPTWGRNRVRTLEALPDVLKADAVLVVKDKEHADLLRLPDIEKVYCPVQGTGIMHVREWILQRAKLLQQEEVCTILDDDVSLKVAESDGAKTVFRKRPDLLPEAFAAVARRCRDPRVGFCSFSQPLFNLGQKPWTQNADNAGTYFINVGAAIRNDLHFRFFIDDRGFMLDTLSSGLQCWAYSYVTATKQGAHGKGGESAATSRGRKHADCIRALATAFPEAVKPYVTSNSAYIQNYGTAQSARFYYGKLWQRVLRDGVRPR